MEEPGGHRATEGRAMEGRTPAWWTREGTTEALHAVAADIPWPWGGKTTWTRLLSEEPVSLSIFCSLNVQTYFRNMVVVGSRAPSQVPRTYFFLCPSGQRSGFLHEVSQDPKDRATVPTESCLPLR